VALGGDKQRCDLHFVVQPGTWISESTFCNFFSGDDSYRTCRGIRIRAVFGGGRRLFDLNALFLSSSVVFFQMPKGIIFVTALYLCGQLSTVYRNVVHRRFSITREAGAMAMRLLQHEVIFNELEGADNGKLSGFISKASVGSSLHQMLERRQCLDAVEISQMTDFALTEVTRHFQHQERDDDGGFCNVLLLMAVMV